MAQHRRKAERGENGRNGKGVQMAADRLIALVIRRLVRVFVNRGIDAGIRRLSTKRGGEDETREQARRRARRAAETAGRARRLVRLLRRFGRF